MNRYEATDRGGITNAIDYARATFGLVLDLSLPTSAKVAKELVRNTEALKAIRMGRAAEWRWVVLAGGLPQKDGGCFRVCSPDAETLLLAFRLANEEMTKKGSPHTLWVFNVEPEQEVVLRAEAACCAGTVGGVQ